MKKGQGEEPTVLTGGFQMGIDRLGRSQKCLPGESHPFGNSRGTRSAQQQMPLQFRLVSGPGFQRSDVPSETRIHQDAGFRIMIIPKAGLQKKVQSAASYRSGPIGSIDEPQKCSPRVAS